MGYQLIIDPLGESVDVQDDQTLLDACLRAGVWLPHACGHGLCGSCKVQVTEGEFEQGNASPFALMDFEREENYCLACCATPLSDLTIEADVDEEPDAEHHPIKDFVGTVARIETLTPSIKGLFIQLPDEGIAFQAGQYINVWIPGEPVPRPFSIASAPSEPNMIELNVKRVTDGKGTGYLHDSLRPGQTLRFSGPYGRFFVRKSDPKPIVLIATGSGLSSPRAMLLDLLEQNSTRHITLIYGARTRSELYYHDALSALAQHSSVFTYIPVLSQPGAACDWQGRQGYVHDLAKEHFSNDFRGHKAYLCGSRGMIENAIRTLMQGRLFEKDIYAEKFLTNADANNARSPLFKSI